ncbi:Aste57867_1149 [Aphanomyces stellatus]|uniref:Aste57867_1149 protein n=1 Tax=Aphanomyces stellatus TaxID=120398 RepID=A0A485K7U6_9STRA|nr:hypothetical protein As57867_001148 [Aphanomyces stellatus]VFT78369.1 Aste57867_1149 [Aphanomyces stellatus]
MKTCVPVLFLAAAAVAADLQDGSAQLNVRMDPLGFTYVAGYQWYTDSKAESTADDFQALLRAINATVASHKHGRRPESLVTPAPDGSSTLPFTSVWSIEECAALVSAHGQAFFTFAPDEGTCLGHHFDPSGTTFLLSANGGAVSQLTLSLPEDFVLDRRGVQADDDCVAACQESAPCAAISNTDECTLYGPASARSDNVFAGWVPADFNDTPVANLPAFEDHYAVHFYTTAHQDDHELFMSNAYHKSIQDGMTKVVFVYTTAGDDHGGNAWREARELGTMAATKAWVDHVGLYDSTPQGETINILGHDITRVTIGNVVNYFLRIPEYGAGEVTGFMALMWNQRPVAPMDLPNQPYANREAFKQVLTQLYYRETQGIDWIVMNAQDPQGEQPDHAMHLATGQLVADIVASDANWAWCVPQYYYYDYQKWFDPVNVDDDVRDLQRYAWLKLSQAIHSYDDSVIFWSEHSINLGRTYIRRSVHEGAGPCPHP